MRIDRGLLELKGEFFTVLLEGFTAERFFHSEKHENPWGVPVLLLGSVSQEYLAIPQEAEEPSKVLPKLMASFTVNGDPRLREVLEEVGGQPTALLRGEFAALLASRPESAGITKFYILGATDERRIPSVVLDCSWDQPREFWSVHGSVFDQVITAKYSSSWAFITPK